MKKMIKIRDLRKKEKFVMDDGYFDKYAKVCGIYATGVYMAICRCAGPDQSCFPGEQFIARKLNISTRTVQRSITKLTKWNIVDIKKEKKKNGTWKCNTYFLLDKECWEPMPSQATDSPIETNQTNSSLKPSNCESCDHTTESRTKETHDKETNNKETHMGDQIKEIKKILDGVNLHIDWKNKKNEKIIQELVDKEGFEKVMMICREISINKGEKFAPVITNPMQLRDKFAQYDEFLARKEKESAPVEEIKI